MVASQGLVLLDIMKFGIYLKGQKDRHPNTPNTQQLVILKKKYSEANTEIHHSI